MDELTPEAKVVYNLLKGSVRTRDGASRVSSCLGSYERTHEGMPRGW